jgi:hypothetical protein
LLFGEKACQGKKVLDIDNWRHCCKLNFSTYEDDKKARAVVLGNA